MKPIIVEVNKLVHNVFKRQHPILAEIIVNWSKIVGTKFSDKAIALKILKLKISG